MSEGRDRTENALDEVLAQLAASAGEAPRTTSPGFTRRVVAALDETGRGRRPGVGGAWALAAAAALAVAVGVWNGSRPEPPLEIAAERETLRQEYGELVRELQSLRSLAHETRPVLYLGSGDDLDLVLDLSPLVQGQGATARPASLQEGTQTPRYY